MHTTTAALINMKNTVVVQKEELRHKRDFSISTYWVPITAIPPADLSVPSCTLSVADRHARPNPVIMSVAYERPESEREDASRRARELVETHPDTRQELHENGRVELFYDTEVYMCHKLERHTFQQ